MRAAFSMREAFGQALAELGNENDRLVVLDADVSKSTRTCLFAAAFPERFFNCGIAEQNMVGVAAGLATMGFIPLVSTFAFLASLRAAEQVRTSVAYPRLNVKIAGGYGGLSDSKDGPTHQSVIDLAVMRAMPNVGVVCASDAVTVRQALRAIVGAEGPWYLRVSRAEVPNLFGPEAPFELGKARAASDGGNDCAVLATGTLLFNAIAAQELLSRKRIRTKVAEIHTLKPIDRDFVIEIARETGAVVTVEEHSIIGGLGGAVSEVLCEAEPVPLVRVGLKDTFAESGELDELQRVFGLDPESIASAVEMCLSRKGKR